MILGPPGPTTPRHKKYSTKGTKESPQFSPRLGRTKLHLVLALELYFNFFADCAEQKKQQPVFVTLYITCISLLLEMLS